MVGKGEGSIGGVEMTEGVGEKVGGGEPLHGISRPVITMRGGPRGYRSPIQPPIHGEVKISPNDAVPAHPCQKWAEALLNEKFLSNRVTRGEVRVDEEEGVTSPKTSHVEEAPIRRPCHSIIPPHDAEEAIGDPVLPNEGSNPPKRPSRVASPDDLVARSPKSGSCSSEPVLHTRPRCSIAIPCFCFLHENDVSTQLTPPSAIEREEFVVRV